MSFRVVVHGLQSEAAKIAVGPEIPPQLATLRIGMFFAIRSAHPKLAWAAFKGNVTRLMSPFGEMAPLFEAQYIPQIFWDSLPPDRMEAWLKAHVPAAMGPQIAKGMEGARFRVAEKAQLVPEANAYLSARAQRT